jgi:serine/threonine protein kinase
MSYYECSLAQWCNHNESLEIIGFSTIMYKCINILSEIHKRHVIHRDIKPHHFMIKKGELFLIDFGLATFTIDDNGEPVKDTTQENIIGTPNYISINHHYGHKPNKRDDLISLGYMMLKLIHGTLPWEAYPNIFREPFHESISQDFNILNHPLNIYKRDKKEWNNLIPVLETTKDILPQLYPFVKYCYELFYDDNTNYELMFDLFQDKL